jgi:two-component system cell cycle sensor histidine kinase/response regulator CckA
MSTILFPHTESDSSRKPSESKTILVAEDDDSTRILACHILRNNGYKVLQAADGKEAVRLATEYEEEIHLIFTDAIMPGIGGQNTVEQIRAFRPRIKAVYTSAYTLTTIIERRILDKDIPFLQKPYDAAGLTQKVRAELDTDTN